MSPQRTSGKGKFSKFALDEEPSPRTSEHVVKKPVVNELGLTQVDSKYAIDPSGGTIVVMEEFHDESAFDTGDFVSVLSKADRRKQLQLAKEAEMKKKRAEERRAAAAAKKALLEEAARKKAEEEAAARKKAEEEAAAIKKAEEEKKRKEQDAKKAVRKQQKVAAKKKELKETQIQGAVESIPPKAERNDIGKQAILRDPAVAGIGSVISRTSPITPAPSLVPLATVTSGTQTDPVRILPIEDPVSSAAAWWLQQQSQPTPQVPPATSNDQLMMQAAYMEAMQRMSPPGLGGTSNSSSYGYWPSQQPSAADLYWQQQQYQPGGNRQQYSR
jgi:hypothetical protein